MIPDKERAMTPQPATAAKAEVADEPSRIEQDYPAWHVWLSQAGRWWATRLGHARPPAGQNPRDPQFAMTLDADTAAKLREALEFQRRRFG
jgi:hypothetical protein